MFFFILSLIQVLPNEIKIPPQNKNLKPILISVDHLNEKYAVYYLDTEEKSVIKTFDKGANTPLFTFKPKGIVIRPLDIEIYQNQLWVSSWPQGFYKIDTKIKKIEKKISGNESVFRFMPIISGYWKSPDIFIGLSRYSQNSNTLPSPHYLELNMEEFVVEDESVIKINNNPNNGTEVKGINLYEIHGENGFNCVNVYEYGWASLCFFDTVFSYRLEDNEYVAKGSRKMPDAVKNYLQFENGEYWAISENGKKIWSGWTGFETTPETLTVEKLSSQFDTTCEDGEFLDFSFSHYLWILTSCKEGNWIFPIKIY